MDAIIANGDGLASNLCFQLLLVAHAQWLPRMVPPFSTGSGVLESHANLIIILVVTIPISIIYLNIYVYSMVI
jgi:hypothetical protein